MCSVQDRQIVVRLLLFDNKRIKEVLCTLDVQLAKYKHQESCLSLLHYKFSHLTSEKLLQS